MASATQNKQIILDAYESMARGDVKGVEEHRSFTIGMGQLVAVGPTNPTRSMSSVTRSTFSDRATKDAGSSSPSHPKSRQASARQTRRQDPEAAQPSSESVRPVAD